MTSRLNVLLVEQKGQFRGLLLKALKRSGFQIFPDISTEKEAMEAVLHTPIDIILCNWDAPESSGLRLLRSLRERSITENLPFLLLNERADHEATALAADYEADGQLVTPVSQLTLENMIQAILKRREVAAGEDLRLARAGAFIDIGIRDEAIKEIESAQTLAPRSPRVMTKSGHLFEQMDENPRAKSNYTKAVDLDENYTRAYDRMGELLIKEGDLDGALEAVQRAAVISPRNSIRQVQLAKVHIGKGNIEEAKRAVEAAAILDGEKGSLSLVVAEFFMENGRSDLAEGGFASILEKDPTNIHVYNRLGISLRHQKKYDESVRNYRKALAMAPRDEVLLYNLALAYYAKGDRGQARLALRQSLMVRADFTEAQIALRRLGG